MHVIINPRGTLQIDDARITFKNFAGRETDYNEKGNRNFCLIIGGGVLEKGREVLHLTAQEMAEALMNETNKYGDGWNIKIKPPFEDGGEPFAYLQVKVSSNRMPAVYVESAGRTRRLTEMDELDMLDRIAIRNVNLDIRPYDDVMRGRSFRSAYLDCLEVFQEIDRFTARYAEEESPEE
jgi:hypothetical protein